MCSMISLQIYRESSRLRHFSTRIRKVERTSSRQPELHLFGSHLQLTVVLAVLSRFNINRPVPWDTLRQGKS